MVEQIEPKRVGVNGVELTYIEQGAGSPVVFVHGSLGDYRSWIPQFLPFSEKYHAISYSRRYHYPNPWSGSGTDYTVSRHADDLIALIEALLLGPVNLVGNSFGAYTSLAAAVRRPDLVRKLVIGEPPILTWLRALPDGQPYWDDFMATTWEPATRAFQSGQLEQGVGTFIDGVSGQAGAFDRVPEPARLRMLDNARELAAETASPGYFTDFPIGQVEQISTPMLLLRGQHSPKMFHRIVDRLAEYVPNAQQAVIPDASHSMPSNNPPVYNQVVMAFLG
jgi:pimeloyl-ACP methyl ester carboxylesterase